MTDEPPTKPSRTGEASSEVENMFDDVFGVDFKVPRTLRDLIVRPGRVFDAAVARDHSRYTRPLRLFLALFAIQTVFFGLAGMQQYQLAGAYGDQPAALAAIEAQLADVGSSVEYADAVIRKWLGWLNWPITILASLLFVLAFWVMRPSRGLFGAFMLYVVVSNATSVVTLPLLAAAVFGGTGLLMASAAGALIAFAVYSGAVMHRRLADTALGLSVRVSAVLLSIIPLGVLIVALTFATLELALRFEVGLSWFELMRTAAKPLSAG